MCADVAGMDYKAPDQIDYTKWEGGGPKSYAPPPEGRYFATAPIFPLDDDPAVFGRTKNGDLKISLDPIKLQGVDYTIRFTTLSAKKYSNRESNQIVDFIKACGLNLQPQTEQEYKDAVRQCSGRSFQFNLIWEAYNKDTQETAARFAKNFPVGADGKPQSWLPDPYDDTKKIFANGKVQYYVPANA